MWHDSTRFHQSKKKYFPLSAERFRDLFLREIVFPGKIHVECRNRPRNMFERSGVRPQFSSRKESVIHLEATCVCWSIIESRQDNKIGWTRWNMLKLIKKDVIRYQIYVPLDVGRFEREESWSTRDAGLNTWLKMYKWRFFFFFFS